MSIQQYIHSYGKCQHFMYIDTSFAFRSTKLEFDKWIKNVLRKFKMATKISINLENIFNCSYFQI